MRFLFWVVFPLSASALAIYGVWQSVIWAAVLGFGYLFAWFTYILTVEKIYEKSTGKECTPDILDDINSVLFNQKPSKRR